MRPRLRLLILAALVVVAGCWTSYSTYKAHTPADSAAGEERVLDYPADNAFELAQDVLRGEGYLFEVNPDGSTSLTTLWHDADNQANLWQSLGGVQPRYRYEIQVTPDGSRRSKIVANLQTQAIPDNQVTKYEASSRIALFAKMDQLAAKFPVSTTPDMGGVNFALMPNENLMGLAKRATGNADNWRQIAKDNQIDSPTDVKPFETIWVRNSLIKQPAKQP